MDFSAILFAKKKDAQTSWKSLGNHKEKQMKLHFETVVALSSIKSERKKTKIENPFSKIKSPSIGNHFELNTEMESKKERLPT